MAMACSYSVPFYFKLSQEGRDIYRITGVVNVTLPHWVDMGKPEQVEVVDSGLVLARRPALPAPCGEPNDRSINVELETGLITGDAGVPAWPMVGSPHRPPATWLGHETLLIPATAFSIQPCHRSF
jgi:hypothetical protein